MVEPALDLFIRKLIVTLKDVQVGFNDYIAGLSLSEGLKIWGGGK